MITPGTKARMIVTVGGEDLVFLSNGEMLAGADAVLRPVWSVGGLPAATALSGGNPKGLMYAYHDGWKLNATNTAGVGASISPGNTGVFGGSDWPDADIGYVTAATSSAAQVIAAVNADVAAVALVTATASGTVTGAVAAVAATNLTGGSDATASPPYLRVAGGYLYVQDSGVWKKTALSAL